MEKPSVSVREAIAAVAGPRLASDTRESWLNRAARKSGVSFRQARSLWYGEIDNPKHLAFRRVIDAAQENGHREANKLAQQFEAIVSAMRIVDPEFHRDTIDTLVGLVGRLRGTDSPGTGQD